MAILSTSDCDSRLWAWLSDGLARQASEKIILSLTGEAHVRRFSNVPLGQFVRTLSNWGPGVYVVGLDYHAGFLVVDADRKVRFIHSPGVGPKHVINESAAESPVLGASRYRVAGRITADAQLLLTWLRQDPIATRTR